MAEQGAFGIALKINTGSLTAIVKLIDLEFPTQEKIIDEMYTHDATGGYLRRIASGARKLGTFKATLIWDDTAATHAALITNLNADTTVGMSMNDPDSQENIAFNAHVAILKRIGKPTEAFKCEVEIAPDGAPTIT